MIISVVEYFLFLFPRVVRTASFQANTLMVGRTVMEGCVWVCGVVRSLCLPPPFWRPCAFCGNGFLSRGFCLSTIYSAWLLYSNTQELGITVVNSNTGPVLSRCGYGILANTVKLP